MQTALRRAKVKMIYSEGFNPHMRIAFALPLSIGIESVCEYMDIRVEDGVECKYVMEMLGKNLPPDMKVLDVFEAEGKLTEIKYASYMIYLDYGDLSEKAADVGAKLFSAPLTVVKKTKKGEKEVDIQPMIKDVNVRYEYGCVVIDCMLCADSESYLNPFYLTNALDGAVGRCADGRKVLRTGAYFADGKLFK